MHDGTSHFVSPASRWAVFLLLLAAAMSWAAKGVLLRAGRMKAADTSALAFAAIAPGSATKAVVRLDRVAGDKLDGTLLERQSETVYARPRHSGLAVSAILSAETPVVMGKPQDIVPGAIVQLAGTLDDKHVLHAKQVVILTGYVRLAEGTGR
jgi:hypothetical protein